MKIKLYFDGASRGNPGSAGAGAYLYSATLEKKLSKSLGQQTNNYAEYQGLLLGLVYLIEHSDHIQDLTEVMVYGDSQLVINQMKGDWKVKSENLSHLYNQCTMWTTQLQNRGIKVSFQYIPRDENMIADALANTGVDRN